MSPTPLDLSSDPQAPLASPSITVDSPVLPNAPADSPLSGSASPSKSPSGTLRGMPASRTTSARSTARTRSRSPTPATTQSLTALSSPAAPSPTGPPRVPIPPAAHATNPQAALSRPSPVVPSSPSVPPTPSYSRPTSPRPSPNARGLAGDEPVSPTRTRGHLSGGDALSSPSGGAGQDAGMLSSSGSQVDLSHIFERDVEFAPSHHISPSEAVDVAVPPVLTEAAVALSVAAEGDPITSRDLAALALDAEYDAVAGSGWSSPVIPQSHGAHPQPPALQQQQQQSPVQDKPPQHQHPLAHVYANASRSPTRGSRSFSPDSGSGGRAASPGSSTFSVGTPPTSAGGGSPPPPPGSLGGPFSQRLAEALENEANKPGLGAPFLGAPSAASAGSAGSGQRGTSPESQAASAPSPPPVPTVAPQGARSLSSSSSFTPLKPSHLMPFPAGTPHGSDDPFTSSPLQSPSHELANNPVAAAQQGQPQPHPRKLSFASYADLVNEERLAELTGERLADVPPSGPGAGGAATPGPGPGTASPMGGRSRSGTRTGPHALGLLQVEQLEGRLAAATLEA